MNTTTLPTRWVLLKRSEGARGNSGKRKTYEVTIAPVKDGTWTMTTAWGMAEKQNRSSIVVKAKTEGDARKKANNAVLGKIERGYELMFAV